MSTLTAGKQSILTASQLKAMPAYSSDCLTDDNLQAESTDSLTAARIDSWQQLQLRALTAGSISSLQHWQLDRGDKESISHTSDLLSTAWMMQSGWLACFKNYRIALGSWRPQKLPAINFSVVANIRYQMYTHKKYPPPPSISDNCRINIRLTASVLLILLWKYSAIYIVKYSF